MNNKQKYRLHLILLTLSVCGITVCHAQTNIGSSPLPHEILQRSYYIPIIYAAYRYGIKISLCTSLFTGLIYFLNAPEHVKNSYFLQMNQYAEILMFQVMGITTGLFADSEKKQRRHAEKNAQELKTAYEELQNTLEMLTHTARLKTLGELSASIAHEIRNPLNAIKGAVEIVSEAVPKENPRHEFIGIIQQEVKRLDTLLSNFLSYARPQVPRKIPTNLNDLVSSVVHFTGTQAYKSGIRIETQLEANLPSVWVDPEQIKQVILNLVINAIQAQPQGGRLDIKSVYDVGQQVVKLQFQDDGTGIPDEVRTKIFEPFFTTKIQGTGLGLAIASQLLKQHDGVLELIETKKGNGSLFVIQIPVTPQSGGER
ncbi:ATP-binding protein [Deltaproteobacteria bacterium TL4]